MIDDGDVDISTGCEKICLLNLSYKLLWNSGLGLVNFVQSACLYYYHTGK